MNHLTDPNSSGRRLGKLTISADLFLSVFQGVHTGYWAKANPIPDDARILGIYMVDPRTLAVFLESERFPVVPEAEPIPELPHPMFGSFICSYADFQRDHPELFPDLEMSWRDKEPML